MVRGFLRTVLKAGIENNTRNALETIKGAKATLLYVCCEHMGNGTASARPT
jgi:hypothetical protein